LGGARDMMMYERDETDGCGKQEWKRRQSEYKRTETVGDG